MKFSDFLFPESRDPQRDRLVLEETLSEARLADELGVDALWLAEHHFDGICAYVDPVSFSAALAVGALPAPMQLVAPATAAAPSKLGDLSRFRGIVVDTAFFRGNFPESCAIYACEIEDPLDLRALDSATWTNILPRTLRNRWPPSFR